MELINMNPGTCFGMAVFFFDLMLCIFTFVKFYEGSQNRYFKLLVVMVTVATLGEILRPFVTVLEYTALNYRLIRLLQSACYIFSCGMAYAYSTYLDSYIKTTSPVRQVMRWVNFGIYMAFVLTMLLNSWTGWVASYDYFDKEWLHGPLYAWVGYGVPGYFLAYTLIHFIKDLGRIDRRIRVTMYVAVGVSIIFMILQPLINVISIKAAYGCSFSVYMWFFAVENFDYTRLKELTDSLRKAEQKAQGANLAKSAFLANMSHEIRTPMTAVLGLDEMILQSNDKDEIDEYAKNIQTAGKTLLSLINDILDFSKIESGKMEIIEHQYHLGQLIDEVCLMISIKASQQGLVFKTDVDEDLPDLLFGDDIRLRQILINILNNAVKYTKKGSVRLKVRGLVTFKSLRLILEVSDTGVGIRKENIPNLFNSFERLDEEKHRTVEGTGLGLAIVKNLLALMDGSIKVDSEYGKGSVFTVEIPQKIEGKTTISAYHEQKKQEKPQHTTRVAPKAQVLVVDDNSVNLIVASGFLKNTKVNVTTCLSGRECLDLMRNRHFDVIFLDHMMPEMDGVETLEKSRELEVNMNRNTPVVALTANAISGMREKYLHMGFADYVSKPIDSEQLYTVLFRLLPPELVEDDPASASPKPFVASRKTGGIRGLLNGSWGVKKTVPEKSGEVSDPQELASLIEEPVIDESSALKLSGGSHAMYATLLETFCEEKESNQTKLIKFLMEEDWENYGVLVHAVKSNALVVGSQELSEQAKALEQACNSIKEGDTGLIAYVQENNGRFMRLYADVCAAARKLVSKYRS